MTASSRHTLTHAQVDSLVSAGFRVTTSDQNPHPNSPVCIDGIEFDNVDVTAPVILLISMITPKVPSPLTHIGHP